MRLAYHASLALSTELALSQAKENEKRKKKKKRIGGQKSRTGNQ